jgi:hypothetical protein
MATAPDGNAARRRRRVPRRWPSRDRDRGIGQVGAEHDKPTGGWPIETGDEPQQRRLARAGWPDHGRHLALTDRDVEAAQGRDGSAGGPMDPE